MLNENEYIYAESITNVNEHISKMLLSCELLLFAYYD